MTETRPPAPSPFRAPWLIPTVVVLLGALFMLGLGIWQLERLQQRRAANAQIMARMSQPALNLAGDAIDPKTSDLRRAAVRGVFDYDQEIILRNRTYGEVPGVHLLVPLRIAGSDAAVLVDRGWIPFEFSGPEQRATFRNAAGEVEVQGILRQSQTRRSSLSPADPLLGPERPRLDAWFRVDLPRIQEQMPYRLLPLYLE
jgi:surfeit locus 1 family protein